MSKLKWIYLPFDALSLQQLYDIMVLRQQVFVVEQDCPYLDADGNDQVAHHLMAYQDSALLAYTRLLPKGVPYTDYMSIGRVVTVPRARQMGLGRQLMQHSIEAIYTLYGQHPIKISAQTYLLRFYKSLGFEPIGEEYLEDGIPHIAMVK